MAAVFVRIGNTIYLKVDGSTTYVKFAGASTAGFTYNVSIGDMLVSKRNDDFGTRYQTISLTGDYQGGNTSDPSRFPGTEIMNPVPGSGVRYYQVFSVGTSPQGQSYSYTTTDTDHLLCLGNTPLTAQGGLLAFPGTGYSNIYLNQSGTYKGAVNIFVKQSGQWAQCQDVYIKENGQWKKTYTNSSEYINMLEFLDDSLDFAIQVLAFDSCTVPPATSQYGVGFMGYLWYNNSQKLRASNGDDRFITNLAPGYVNLSPFTTAGGVYTTYDQIASFIINHYTTYFARYPEGIGFDGWMNDFIFNSSYENYSIFEDTINTAYFYPGAEFDQRSALNGLYGHYDDCSVRRR